MTRGIGGVRTGWIYLIAELMCSSELRAEANVHPPSEQVRMVEWTIESRKQYADPFNDVDVDVLFSKDGQSWRVPAFWRGGQRWAVRFAPSTPGRYDFRLESTDKSNPDLNGHWGEVTIRKYSGGNPLLIHGVPRVSSNKRFFEYADGKPFYWLGDTWWMGLSSRLSWKGFQRLTADRKGKGFTVVQLVAGLVPDDELCPSDPGCRNEGGAVWDSGFKDINPAFFDYADRRVQLLVNGGIVPAIVGAWGPVLDQIGATKLKKHWRYIIARYGSYPVFWIVGGEIYDPTRELAQNSTWNVLDTHPGAWSDITRYVRETDPYHHPIAVHEVSPDDPPVQQEALTDFRLFQPGHFGWASLAVEVGQLNRHYSRTEVTKPLVVGEIGYEMLGRTHLEDFQRFAFWLAMLNGAAGFTYGAAGTWESYTTDLPFPRSTLSLLTWEEGMTLPGSYEVGLGARLLQRYAWWRFTPHPEWIEPRGTTLLEPHGGVDQFHVDLGGEQDWASLGLKQPPESEWKKHGGNFRLPYAAGIAGQVRTVYMPSFGLISPDPPTIFGLELGVRYQTYYWEPSLGIKVDLGEIERPVSGPVLFADHFREDRSAWTDYGTQSVRGVGKLDAHGHLLTLVDDISLKDLVVGVDAQSKADAALVLRYHDQNNFLEAVYSAQERTIYILEHRDGTTDRALGVTPVPRLGEDLRLAAELRGEVGIMSLSSAGKQIETPIVTVRNVEAGKTGLTCDCGNREQQFTAFEVRQSASLRSGRKLERKLYDAEGRYRGELSGPGGPGMRQPVTWAAYAEDRHLLLDAYLPPVLPTPGDWILVMDAEESAPGVQ